MKISYKWLKDYLAVNLDVHKIGEILTNIGLEVESIEEIQAVKGGLKGLVIGEVLECEKHKDADKLSVTLVDIGEAEKLKIVCGAPNVAKGQKVVVATVGTVLYSGDKEFVIKKSKIRGEDSQGMICAEDEIGIGNSHAGIIVLPADTQIGMAASTYFNIESDFILEIGITPNRVDGTSHIGVARDLAAYLNVFSENEVITYKKPSIENFTVDNNDLTISVQVENSEACPRYSAVTIANVEVKESPEWLKTRLEAIGQKPINNVVDITNYVLHETGQPLHAFDADMITGKKVIVKTLENGTKFKTLDLQERNLNDRDLMICNTAEGMCMAGVFGGEKSGTTEKTKNIFLESAYFNPVCVRKTAKRHGLSTDSSFRFERGTDPNNTIYALKRAALLIKEIAGGSIASDVVDIYHNTIQNFIVEVSFANIKRLIGKEIDKALIRKILTSLEITILNETADSLQLSVPPYRVDVQREADIIEEILRIYGFNNVEMNEEVHSTLSYIKKPNREVLINKVADLLVSNGFNEAMSNSLTKVTYYETEEAKKENLVHIKNPISQDLNVLRQTLLFGGLEAVAFNNNHKNFDLKLFEFGNCYFAENHKDKSPLKGFYEETNLALFISGNRTEINWNSHERRSDFYFLKSNTDLILQKLNFNVQNLEQKEINDDELAYGLSYSLHGKQLVKFGSVKRKLLKMFDIENEVFYAVFNWGALLEKYNDTVKFTEIVKYPEVRRDLALLIDKNVSYSQLRLLAFKTEKKLLKNVNIFDVYEGKNIETGKKSYALSFYLQDDDKTLTDKQIEKIMRNLAQVFEKEVNAKIR